MFIVFVEQKTLSVPIVDVFVDSSIRLCCAMMNIKTET